MYSGAIILDYILNQTKKCLKGLIPKEPENINQRLIKNYEVKFANSKKNANQSMMKREAKPQKFVEEIKDMEKIKQDLALIKQEIEGVVIDQPKPLEDIILDIKQHSDDVKEIQNTVMIDATAKLAFPEKFKKAKRDY